MPRCLPPGRKKGPPESHRECRSCHAVKPLDSEHFGASTTCRNGFLSHCRPCQLQLRRIYNKTTARQRIRESPAKPVRQGELCDAADGCFGLAHRVRGKKCRHCGLAFAEEPKPEFTFRQHFERAI